MTNATGQGGHSDAAVMNYKQRSRMLLILIRVTVFQEN